jgi:hypothetical protein
MLIPGGICKRKNKTGLSGELDVKSYVVVTR